jgi:hypothetical protein
LTMALLASPARATISASRCEAAAAPRTSILRLASKHKMRTPLVRPTSRTLKVNLGSTSEIQIHTFAIQTPALKSSQTIVAELNGDLERTDASTFPANQIAVIPTVTRLGEISLQVCLDPHTPSAVGPGRYVGAITLGGPNIEPTALPLEVTVQASAKTALLWIGLGVTLGLISKMLLDITKDPKKELGWKALGEYVHEPVFGLALLTGIVGALVNFLALYEPNPTWGSSFDEVKIFVAGVVLQTTGTTLTDVIMPYKGK